MPSTTVLNLRGLTVTDEYKDRLVVYPGQSEKDRIYVQVDEGEESCEVSLNHYQAQEVAKELNRLVGKTISTTTPGKVPNTIQIPLRPGDDTFNESMLRVAVAQRRVVRFRYAKDQGEYIETRTVEAHKIAGEGESLAVVGYDPDRGETRRYRLDRIKGEVEFA